MKNNKTSKEHILESIWILREKGISSYSDLVNNSIEPDIKELIADLQEDDLIFIEEDSMQLTPKGDKYSESIIRRHRLGEVLFSQIFEIEESGGKDHACEFEHILTPEVTESICTFLGHPHRCPHDLPIPRGECCAAFNTKIGPMVKPLIDLKIGDLGKIVFMSPKTHLRLDKLMTFGITPGSVIKLHQKNPSVVLKIDETDLAIDEEIAKNIYVKDYNGSSL